MCRLTEHLVQACTRAPRKNLVSGNAVTSVAVYVRKWAGQERID